MVTVFLKFRGDLLKQWTDWKGPLPVFGDNIKIAEKWYFVDKIHKEFFHEKNPRLELTVHLGEL